MYPDGQNSCASDSSIAALTVGIEFRGIAYACVCVCVVCIYMYTQSGL